MAPPSAPGGDARKAFSARGESTAASIRAAATELFAQDGFSTTTVRSIAAAAGVNPALVIRYFGSKEALFLDVVDRLGPPALHGGRRFADVLAGPLDQLGQRLTRFVLQETQAEQSTIRDVFVALSRAMEHVEVRERLRQTTAQQLVEPLAARLETPTAQLQAQLVAVQISGLMAALWVAPEAALTTADPDQVSALYGRAVQQLIDAAAPLP